jgi:hypothetical protein
VVQDQYLYEASDAPVIMSGSSFCSRFDAWIYTQRQNRGFCLGSFTHGEVRRHHTRFVQYVVLPFFVQHATAAAAKPSRLLEARTLHLIVPGRVAKRRAQEVERVLVSRRPAFHLSFAPDPQEDYGVWNQSPSRSWCELPAIA